MYKDQWVSKGRTFAPRSYDSSSRSDELLKEDSRTKFKIQSLGDNKYFVVLDLDDVVETDAGLYKVKAKNKMGEVAASINLNFSRKYHFILFHNIFFIFKVIL